MGKPKRFNAYDSDVDASRKTIENYGRARQVFSTGSSFRSAPFQPPIAVTSGSSSSSGTFGLGDPIILTEVNLGNTLSGAVEIDCSQANKFRGIMTGNVTISFINPPPNDGFYQPVIVELKQDATGGRTVTWADPIENDHDPILNKDADQYTVWAFFFSHRTDPGTPDEVEFAFNTVQSVSLVIAASDEYTQLSASNTIPAITFRMPYAMTVTEVKGSLTTAGGSNTVVDIHSSATTILSPLLTIDSGSETSIGSGTPVGISDSSLGDDEEMEIFIKTAGASATGLKVTLTGWIS